MFHPCLSLKIMTVLLNYLNIKNIESSIRIVNGAWKIGSKSEMTVDNESVVINARKKHLEQDELFPRTVHWLSDK